MLSPDGESMSGLYQAEASRWGKVIQTNGDMDDYLLSVADKGIDVYNRQYLIASKFASRFSYVDLHVRETSAERCHVLRVVCRATAKCLK